jgi:hydroxymethylbilane synthase
MPSPIYIATRGSALALVQARYIQARCQSVCPAETFELKIMKTTGDKLQAVPPTESPPGLGKGLFTKELEVALLAAEAGIAVHSLKDLPTELPAGLVLAAVPEREDPRDVLICRNEAGSLKSILDLPQNAVVATSSTRRAAQLGALRPDVTTVPVRGNVGTRLEKLARNRDFDGMILAMAGLKRLGFKLHGNQLEGPNVPPGLTALVLSTEEMLPCVGQAALGIETRCDDPQIDAICRHLDHRPSHLCVEAERSFLAGMGGGCLSPVGALAELDENQIFMRGVSFRDGKVKRGEVRGPSESSSALGQELAKMLL